MFANLRDRVESRIETINADVTIDGDRKIRAAGNARTGEHTLKFDIKAAPPAPPIERQNIPTEFKIDAPGLLQAPLSGKAEVRLNGSVVMINGLTGVLGDGAYNGWASVDLREQAAGEARSRLPAARCRDGAQGARRSFVAALEQRDDRPQRPQLRRRAGADFRSLAQYRRGALRAGRDRGDARERRAEDADLQSRRL